MRRCPPVWTRRPRTSSPRSARTRDRARHEHRDARRPDRLVIVSTVTQQAGPATPAGPARPLSERRPLGDRTFQLIALGSGLLVLVILVLIAVTTTQQAAPWFSAEGWGIFGMTWNPAT